MIQYNRTWQLCFVTFDLSGTETWQQTDLSTIFKSFNVLSKQITISSDPLNFAVETASIKSIWSYPSNWNVQSYSVLFFIFRYFSSFNTSIDSGYLPLSVKYSSIAILIRLIVAFASVILLAIATESGELTFYVPIIPISRAIIRHTSRNNTNHGGSFWSEDLNGNQSIIKWSY